MRGAIPAAIATATVLALGIGVFVFLLVMARHATPFHQLIAVWHGLDSDLRLVVDLAGIGLSIAVGVRLYRMRQATIYDHQADRCRGCGHDVSHAPLETGCGRCPECGLDFATYGAGGRDG